MLSFLQNIIFNVEISDKVSVILGVRLILFCFLVLKNQSSCTWFCRSAYIAYCAPFSLDAVDSAALCLHKILERLWPQVT